MTAQTPCGEYIFVAVGLGATCAVLLGVILCVVYELDWRTKNMSKVVKPQQYSDFVQGRIDKHLHSATYENPYQAPYASNDYSQNVAPPSQTGGGPAYTNPQSVVDQQFFNPTTPNDSAFSDTQAANEIGEASPIAQIMSDFDAAQKRLEQ